MLFGKIEPQPKPRPKLTQFAELSQGLGQKVPRLEVDHEPNEVLPIAPLAPLSWPGDSSSCSQLQPWYHDSSGLSVPSLDHLQMHFSKLYGWTNGATRKSICPLPLTLEFRSALEVQAKASHNFFLVSIAFSSDTTAFFFVVSVNSIEKYKCHPICNKSLSVKCNGEILSKICSPYLNYWFIDPTSIRLRVHVIPHSDIGR